MDLRKRKEKERKVYGYHGMDRSTRFCFARFFRDLSSQTELGDDGTIPFDVVLLEVTEEVASVTDHLVQTAAAVVVLLVVLEVFGKRVDAEGQDCNLDFRRTGVAFVYLVLFDKSLLLFLGNHILHLWFVNSESDVIAAAGEAFPGEWRVPFTEERPCGNRDPTPAAWTLSITIIPQNILFVKVKTEILFDISRKNTVVFFFCGRLPETVGKIGLPGDTDSEPVRIGGYR